MRIEHIGLAVTAPQSMADWYVTHLGFHRRFDGGSDADGVAFIADPTQEVMLELFRIPGTPPLPWEELAPLTLHLALHSDDPPADAARLVQAGATFLERNPRTPNPGDILILLRDPWGGVIQLVKREKAL
jgi:catechol 2,3-dioxygenase-like lactoylglutathione lyase family enzyme